MARKERFDPDEVRAKTLDYIAKCRAKAAVHAVVLEVLKGWQGKQINKRMATAVEKALGADYSVYWRTEYSWTSIRVWNKTTIPYNEYYDVMIAYDSDAYPNGERRFDFDYWLGKYGNAYGMQNLNANADKSEAALRFLDQRVNAYNAAMAAAENAYAEMEGLATWS